jgi:hypothetical protein
MVFLVVSLRRSEALFNEIHVSLGRPDARRRLLLKSVQHVHGLREPNGIDRPVGVPVVGLDEFQNAGPEALPRLGVRGNAAELRNAKSVAHVVPDRFRETEKVALRRPYPM